MKTIKDFPNYEITNDGKVWSKPRKALNSCRNLKGRWLVPSLNNWDYLLVGLYNETGKSTKYVHRLVAETYIPNPDNKPEVNHLDFDKSNNHFSNLEWVSETENSKHYQDSRPPFDGYKLDETKVLQIKQMRCDGMQLQSIADIFGVTRGYVSRLLNHN